MILAGAVWGNFIKARGVSTVCVAKQKFAQVSKRKSRGGSFCPFRPCRSVSHYLRFYFLESDVEVEHHGAGEPWDMDGPLVV